MQGDGKDFKRLFFNTWWQTASSDAQHGFVPGRDCITQLLICIEEWSEMLERGKTFGVVYTDFAYAFNSVPPQMSFAQTSRGW